MPLSKLKWPPKLGDKKVTAWITWWVFTPLVDIPQRNSPSPHLNISSKTTPCHWPNWDLPLPDEVLKQPKVEATRKQEDFFQKKLCLVKKYTQLEVFLNFERIKIGVWVWNVDIFWIIQDSKSEPYEPGNIPPKNDTHEENQGFVWTLSTCPMLVLMTSQLKKCLMMTKREGMLPPQWFNLQQIRSFKGV